MLSLRPLVDIRLERMAAGGFMDFKNSQSWALRFDEADLSMRVTELSKFRLSAFLSPDDASAHEAYARALSAFLRLVRTVSVGRNFFAYRVVRRADVSRMNWVRLLDEEDVVVRTPHVIVDLLVAVLSAVRVYVEAGNLRAALDLLWWVYREHVDCLYTDLALGELYLSFYFSKTFFRWYIAYVCGWRFVQRADEERADSVRRVELLDLAEHFFGSIELHVPVMQHSRRLVADVKRLLLVRLVFCHDRETYGSWTRSFVDAHANASIASLPLFRWLRLQTQLTRPTRNCAWRCFVRFQGGLDKFEIESFDHHSLSLRLQMSFPSYHEQVSTLRFGVPDCRRVEGAVVASRPSLPARPPPPPPT